MLKLSVVHFNVINTWDSILKIRSNIIALKKTKKSKSNTVHQMRI